MEEESGQLVWGIWETSSLKCIGNMKKLLGWLGLGVLSIAGNGYYSQSCCVSVGEIWVDASYSSSQCTEPFYLQIIGRPSGSWLI